MVVTHLGYHGCVGLSQVDFKLTDAVADLPDAASFQIEAPLALDCCVMPVRRVGTLPETVRGLTRAELGIAETAIVFGAFVSLLKLSPRCLELWRDIMQRVPRAVLAFSPGNASEEALYRNRVAGFGIDPARVIFIPRAADDIGDRARYRLIDVVLDTMPYTGGDTTAAALEMGVPVVTRAGLRHAERVSFSLLFHLGVTDTVTHSDQDYVATACRLADDAGVALRHRGADRRQVFELGAHRHADATRRASRMRTRARSRSSPARRADCSRGGRCASTFSASADRSWAASRRSPRPRATR